MTHEHSRSWKEGKDGDLLNIHIDTMTDEEYEEYRDEVVRMEHLLPKILEGKPA